MGNERRLGQNKLCTSIERQRANALPQNRVHLHFNEPLLKEGSEAKSQKAVLISNGAFWEEKIFMGLLNVSSLRSVDYWPFAYQKQWCFDVQPKHKNYYCRSF